MEINFHLNNKRHGNLLCSEKRYERVQSKIPHWQVSTHADHDTAFKHDIIMMQTENESQTYLMMTIIIIHNNNNSDYKT